MPVDLSTTTDLACLPTRGGPVTSASTSDEGTPKPAPWDQEGLAGVAVLVVDDDAPGARLLQVLLSNAGATVRMASSAEEALEVLADFSPSLFVVDLILPGASGLLLARRLREISPESVIVAVSVAHGPEVERRAIECGCVALIHKPIDVITFVSTIRHLLARRAPAGPAS